jgi:hypothetical protein
MMNCSTLNKSCTISLKIIKPPWCTQTHEVLSNTNVVWDFCNMTNKTYKTNKLPTLIYRSIGQRGNIPSSNRNFYFGSLQSFNFFIMISQPKWRIAKKSWIWESPPFN